MYGSGDHQMQSMTTAGPCLSLSPEMIPTHMLRTYISALRKVLCERHILENVLLCFTPTYLHGLETKNEKETRRTEYSFVKTTGSGGTGQNLMQDKKNWQSHFWVDT